MDIVGYYSHYVQEVTPALNTFRGNYENQIKSNPFCTCFKTIVKSQQPSASNYL